MATSWANEIFSSEAAVRALARFRTLMIAGKPIPSDLAREIELSLSLHAGSAIVRDARDRNLIRAAGFLPGSPTARAAVIVAVARGLDRGKGGLSGVARGVPAAAIDWILQAQRVGKIPGTARQVYRIIAPALTSVPCSLQAATRDRGGHGDLPLRRNF